MLEKENILLEKALSQVPRILTQIDRDPASATYGCGERYYWKYKTHDFLNARFQENCMLLALVWSKQAPGNIYYQNEKIRALALATIDYWGRSQRRNGSFDEIYPHENSFIATAFTTFSVCESILILGDSKNNGVKNALVKAGKWLSKNDHPIVSNQMAAVATALAKLTIVLGDNDFKVESDLKLKILKDEYTKHGFFPEYGGFDAGYTSLNLYFLSKLKLLNESSGEKFILDNELKASAEKIAALVDGNGRYDNTQMSRQTQYLYPFAFKLLDSPVYEKILEGLAGDKIVQPAWMDDRFCLFLTINYFDTYFLLQ